MVDEGMLNLIACLSQSVVVIQDASKGILVGTTAFLIGNLKIPNLDQRNTRNDLDFELKVFSITKNSQHIDWF